jgi:hypothetical protein
MLRSDPRFRRVDKNSSRVGSCLLQSGDATIDAGHAFMCPRDMTFDASEFAQQPTTARFQVAFHIGFLSAWRLKIRIGILRLIDQATEQLQLKVCGRVFRLASYIKFAEKIARTGYPYSASTSSESNWSNVQGHSLGNVGAGSFVSLIAYFTAF